MARLLVAAVTVALLATLAQFLLPAPATALLIQDEPTLAVVALTNDARQGAGAAPLTVHPALTEAAQFHAQWMTDTGCFEHRCDGEPDLRARIEAAGYMRWSAIAENIAYGQPTPEVAVTGWLNSPGHRRNMLNTRFTEIGVGLTYDGNGRPYWVQVFGARRAS
jgi:uncharacterized protein YkwD